MRQAHLPLCQGRRGAARAVLVPLLEEGREDEEQVCGEGEDTRAFRLKGSGGIRTGHKDHTYDKTTPASGQSCAAGFVIQGLSHKWSPDTRIALGGGGLELRVGDKAMTGRDFRTDSVAIGDGSATFMLRSRKVSCSFACRSA